jgi:hypothetical protein
MKSVLIAVLATFLGIGVAAAGNEHSKGSDHPNYDKNGNPPGFSEDKGKKTGWDNGEPPGWEQGSKQGWDEEKDRPPGLEDKNYKK